MCLSTDAAPEWRRLLMTFLHFREVARMQAPIAVHMRERGGRASGREAGPSRWGTGGAGGPSEELGRPESHARRSVERRPPPGLIRTLP